MITIPITLILFIVAVTVGGAILGVLFTVFFMFGCDNKYFKQNAIVGVMTSWVVVLARILTESGIVVWK